MTSRTLFIGGCADGRMIRCSSDKPIRLVEDTVGPIVSLIHEVTKRTFAENEYFVQRVVVDEGEPIELRVFSELSMREVMELLIENYRPDVVTEVEELKRKLMDTALELLNLKLSIAMQEGRVTPAMLEEHAWRNRRGEGKD